MPSADQVPVNSTHSMMRWHKWVVLIAGSTGSALRAVCPFQPSHHAGCPTRSRLRRKCDGLLVALASNHHGPDHSRDLVGKRDGGDLGRPPREQCRKPGPMLGAMDLGIADDGERAGDEQAAQIAVTLLADTAEPVLAPARMLFRHGPDRGREGAAWIGLIQKQHSGGGKDRLGGISKQGDRYLRSLFVAGALAVIRYAKIHGAKHRPWLTALLARRPTKVAAIALANKIARMAWAMMARPC